MTRNLFRCLPITALAMIVAVPAAALHAQGASASPSIQEQLEAQYPLAKMTAKGGCAISNPETGLALQKAGPAALPQRSSSPMCASHYRNGSFTKPGFKCTYYLNMTKQSLVNLEKGDKVFPTKLEIDKDDIKVSFGYCSGDPGQAVAYIGEVVVEFPKDSLKAASVNQIEDKIAEVLSADGGDQQSQGGGQSRGNQNSQSQDSQPQKRSTNEQSIRLQPGGWSNRGSGGGSLRTAREPVKRRWHQTALFLQPAKSQNYFYEWKSG
jgi:hypothetical protein